MDELNTSLASYKWGIHYQTNIKLLISDEPQAVSHKSDPTETSSVHTAKPGRQKGRLIAHEYAVSNMKQVNVVTGRNSRWLSADLSQQSQFTSTQIRCYIVPYEILILHTCKN